MSGSEMVICPRCQADGRHCNLCARNKVVPAALAVEYAITPIPEREDIWQAQIIRMKARHGYE